MWGLLVLWLLGWAIFGVAADRGVMWPVGKYEDFNPAVYSLDTVVPIINFHMEKYWEPNLEKAGEELWGVATCAWWYLRVHIAMGWIFSTLAVVGFTGIVRKD